MQAIEYFTAGCREGTLLKHKLLCDEPTTLDELLVIAEESVLEEGALSAPGGEVFYGLNLVHPLAGVAELGPTREVVAS